MQATVWSFDAGSGEGSGEGSVVLDDGTLLPFSRDVFAASGLRLLRPGQRVRLRLDGNEVAALTILTLPDPAP